jgi:hypothetical protein
VRSFRPHFRPRGWRTAELRSTVENLLADLDTKIAEARASSPPTLAELARVTAEAEGLIALLNEKLDELEARSEPSIHARLSAVERVLAHELEVINR